MRVCKNAGRELEGVWKSQQPATREERRLGGSHAVSERCFRRFLSPSVPQRLVPQTRSPWYPHHSASLSVSSRWRLHPRIRVYQRNPCLLLLPAEGSVKHSHGCHDHTRSTSHFYKVLNQAKLTTVLLVDVYT